jgi:predicted O-linked N-acetylglucosamine transferase (SPINDLY family)
MTYYQQGKLTDAAECGRQALRSRPDDVPTRIVLGVVLRDLRQLTEAEACFRRALRTNEAHAELHAHLGLTLHHAGREVEARAAYERSLELAPNNASTCNNLGNTLKALGDLDLAERYYRQAIAIQPEFASAHNNLGALLVDRARYREAAAELTLATRHDPKSALAWCNLAGALREAGELEAGVSAAIRAIELDPNMSYAHSNLGILLKALGRVDQAIAAYRRAIELSPDSPLQGSNLVYALNFDPSYDPDAIWAEHRRWGQTHTDPLTAASAPHTNDRSPDRRLRIGYVSAHFKDHAVNFFVEPILAHHDPAAAEIFCYANLDRGDQTTDRLKNYAQHWRPIAALSDEHVAQQIRADQIDILVDLSGHIAGNRLQVFAHKPAPVQVTYIGYQNTTGMAAMDYRLTDDWSDPPGTTDAFYTERLVRLPQSFFCYQPSADAPAVTPLPALERGYVTFGSFNNFAKITPQVLATWADILNRVSGSRLVLLADTAPSLAAHVRCAFAARGVAADRVELVARRPRGEYLRLINQVDIALDPFPFNGHTTTCDALWQGLPVVCLAGNTYPQRFGSSALVTLGMAELVAGSIGEYMQIAATLAADPERLAGLRATLRARMAASPLMDFAGFTRNLEAAYRRMWTDWCAATGQR